MFKTPEISDLAALAARYQEEAGRAYAAGDDSKAAAYRDAANPLTTLVVKLPPLPEVEGPTYRGAGRI